MISKHIKIIKIGLYYVVPLVIICFPLIGIFVSRFSEEIDAEERFAGLINIGDEILDVNGHSVSNASLDDVYDLMCDQTLEVKILPLLSRKDIHEESS